ncbi:hypothetical protein CONPUDRAFT_158918 [Coniophora puteana RWD-64-598 SS2]|uniref:Uncharacterized protein n=1 Tax=Coniophora puteana (strain RWD-64-598) TaxID=741705 RepID=A0A5M3M9Y7_CONPW|nr:uncharacterized protein CONPUDRAFT_158918 [Coniophora puteana RWD-64-598 SS2]EIW75455.1 hypothetical protein CONPUDRAFT_158918 [Coniophora puteana RWD-64-598 SS2]
MPEDVLASEALPAPLQFVPSFIVPDAWPSSDIGAQRSTSNGEDLILTGPNWIAEPYRTFRSTGWGVSRIIRLVALWFHMAHNTKAAVGPSRDDFELPWFKDVDTLTGIIRCFNFLGIQYEVPPILCLIYFAKLPVNHHKWILESEKPCRKWLSENYIRGDYVGENSWWSNLKPKRGSPPPSAIRMLLPRRGRDYIEVDSSNEEDVSVSANVQKGKKATHRPTSGRMMGSAHPATHSAKKRQRIVRRKRAGGILGTGRTHKRPRREPVAGSSRNNEDLLDLEAEEAGSSEDLELEAGEWSGEGEGVWIGSDNNNKYVTNHHGTIVLSSSASETESVIQITDSPRPVDRLLANPDDEYVPSSDISSAGDVIGSDSDIDIDESLDQMELATARMQVALDITLLHLRRRGF